MNSVLTADQPLISALDDSDPYPGLSSCLAWLASALDRIHRHVVRVVILAEHGGSAPPATTSIAAVL
jgi:hypothetical protein